MTYPDNFEQKIGFNDIRKLLKGRCLSSLGTAEVDKISFQDKASIIKEMLQQTHEFRTILMVEDEFPSDNYLDMRDSLIRSQVKGVYLEESQKWVNFMNENNISWANWSLSDKNESSALLINGAPNNSLDDNYLSESGKFIKQVMKEKQD